MDLGTEAVLEGSEQVVGRKSRDKWTAKQEETLREMWVADYTKKEMSRKVGHSIPTIYVKAKKLGLPMNVVKQHRMDSEPIEVLRTKGIVKCHNCLEQIVLSKKGLDKNYKGGRVGKETIFWHLPGKCTGDRNAHFNQLEKKRRRGRGRPSEDRRWDR